MKLIKDLEELPGISVDEPVLIQCPNTGRVHAMCRSIAIGRGSFYYADQNRYGALLVDRGVPENRPTRYYFSIHKLRELNQSNMYDIEQ